MPPGPTWMGISKYPCSSRKSRVRRCSIDSPSPLPPPPLPPLLASAGRGWASACAAAAPGALLPAAPPAPAAAAECTESRRASAFVGLRARACLLGTLRQLPMGPLLAGAGADTGTEDEAGTIVIARELHRQGRNVRGGGNGEGWGRGGCGCGGCVNGGWVVVGVGWVRDREGMARLEAVWRRESKVRAAQRSDTGQSPQQRPPSLGTAGIVPLTCWAEAAAAAPSQARAPRPAGWRASAPPPARSA